MAVQIEVGTLFTIDGEEHRVSAVTDGYVITDHEGVERVFNRNHIEARLGNLPLVSEAGVRLVETWYSSGKLDLHVEGSSSPVMMWAHYRTGRSLTIHPDGTWTQDPA